VCFTQKSCQVVAGLSRMDFYSDSCRSLMSDCSVLILQVLSWGADKLASALGMAEGKTLLCCTALVSDRSQVESSSFLKREVQRHSPSESWFRAGGPLSRESASRFARCSLFARSFCGKCPWLETCLALSRSRVAATGGASLVSCSWQMKKRKSYGRQTVAFFLNE
jgi:hypothetical protein